MFRLIKRAIVNRWPALVGGYHMYRQLRAMDRHRQKRTPYGFFLKGHFGMQSGTYESTEVEVISRYLKRASVFVDIGANIGFFVCLARQMGKKVLAVEPLWHNLDELYVNLMANGYDDVEIFPVGLAEKPGLGIIYGAGTSASIVAGWAGTSKVFKRPVALTTLDMLLDNRFISEQLFIKVDVEGSEYRVLQGAQKTLIRCPRPVWLIEVCLTEHHPAGFNPNFENVFNTFWQLGYQAFAVDEQNRVVSAEDVERWVGSRKKGFGHVSYLFERLKK